jgi:hypothetical protein
VQQAMSDEEERYLMNKDLAAFIEKQTGIRIAPTTLEKLAAPGRGPDGIPIDAYYNKRPLRKPSTVLAWARSRLRHVQPPETA